MKDKKNINVENNNDQASESTEKRGFFATIGGWFSRMFFGGSNSLYRERRQNDVFAVEAIESPGKQRLKAFMSKKLAVGALCVFILMFIVMLVGPIFFELDLAYQEDTQKNVSPGLNMMSVPGSLKKDIATLSSGSKFTVGLSKSGKVYIWGDTKFLLADLSDIPDEVKSKKIVHVAAGTDHAIAIAEDGTVYGWGQNTNGQYGPVPKNDASLQFLYTFAPDEILNGKIDVKNVKQLVCGKQVTAIVMNDGSAYIWGNHSSGATNMGQISKLNNIEKIVFTNEYAVALLKDGTFSVGATTAFDVGYLCKDGTTERIKIKDFLANNSSKIVDIGSTGGSAAFVFDDGSVIISGVTVNGESSLPAMGAGEKIVSIDGGQKHYTAITNKGNVYSWGSDVWNQASVPAKLSGVSKVFVGPFQNYAVDENGELIDKWGLSGYVMGTDGFGRDIWNRIVNGGRLTMTIGAIAVVISSIIGIIVGCLSGYFGGWVDMLLMRVAEIVSAIPFLPFALILSVIVQTMGLSERTRIVLIMVILGVLSWTGLARLVRGQVLAEREKEFVIAAKAMGVKERIIAFKHILPNVISIIIVSMTLDFAGCMLTESSLSYLGFGVQLPRPTWGNMLNGANNSIIIQNYWWQWFFPSLFLMITTICINIIGDALRDVMDPKSNSGR